MEREELTQAQLEELERREQAAIEASYPLEHAEQTARAIVDRGLHLETTFDAATGLFSTKKED